MQYHDENEYIAPPLSPGKPGLVVDSKSIRPSGVITVALPAMNFCNMLKKDVHAFFLFLVQIVLSNDAMNCLDGVLVDSNAKDMKAFRWSYSKDTVVDV